MRNLALAIFCLLISGNLSAQWHVDVLLGYGTYINESDLVEERRISSTSETRSSYNISQGLSSIAFEAGIGYEVSERWSIDLALTYLDASGAYFEDRVLIRNNVEFSDFAADAEIQTIDIGLAVRYDVVSSESVKLGFSVGPNVVSRDHTYRNELVYFIDDDDQLTFTKQEFTTSEVTEIGAQLGAHLDIPLTDQVSLIGQAIGLAYFDSSDNAYRFQAGVKINL